MRLFSILFFLLLCSTGLSDLWADEIVYPDAWNRAGISLGHSGRTSVEVNFSIKRFSIQDKIINGSAMQTISLPGNFLPNDEGMPDLPGISRFVAIPRGSSVEFRIVDFRTESIPGIVLAPAPRIPFDTEDGDPEYQRNESIYTQDAFWPSSPVQVSDVKQMRGVDCILLGLTPFQYNPVSGELLVYRDIKIEVTFSGGADQFGEERLRNRWWDSILNDRIINYSILPKIQQRQPVQNSKAVEAAQDVEYLIITPDDPDFLAWADSLRVFRNQQGISTGIVTTAEIGGNTFSAIENYINNAYNTWNPAPAAILLLGDYGTTGNTIASSSDQPHPYSGTYISDNFYADVDGDDLPDLITSRITAQNATQLETMVRKILDYERHPPTNPDFYNHPVTAMGWQTERWFQLCSETVYGFWEQALGKAPIRENAIYSGTPNEVWSTATNTETIVDYFGPNGLGYIPQTPAHLTDWGGNATRINNDINNGAFMIQHRDHGSETGWGEPDYGNSDLSGLHNNDLTFVFSINCLTGRFDWSGECFAEAFHRYENRALGLIAATQVSYSFVNDAYSWGMYDNMWPQFMPNEETTFSSRFILPAFANAAGKYFLMESNWPYNTDDKQITYYLFHHHGGSFSMVYSEVPQELSVSHNNMLEANVSSFTVNSDEGALIGLSVNGALVGVGEGTGGPVEIPITPQVPGNNLLITVTKQNFYRYTQSVPILEMEGPYIAVDEYSVDDTSTGNANGHADFNETFYLNLSAINLGSDPATDVQAKLRSDDIYLHVSDSVHIYGNMEPDQVVDGSAAFSCSMSDDVPDQYRINLQIAFQDTGSSPWTSQINLTVNAPQFDFGQPFINDSQTGNNNGRLDPGETANFVIPTINRGHASAPETNGAITSLSAELAINTNVHDFGTFVFDDTVNAIFSLTAGADIALGSSVYLACSVTSGAYSTIDTFEIVVGAIPEFLMSDQSVTVSNAYFYDTGGRDGDYSSRERLTMTFRAEPGSEALSVQFGNFDVADGDELYIYDGPDRNAPAVPGSPFSGTALPPTYISTNPEAALTFYFASNLISNTSGWSAELNAQIPLEISIPESAPIGQFRLLPNFPNPFNPATTIAYELPERSHVSLVLYNVLGEKVRSLTDRYQDKGHYRLELNAADLNSGVYYCRMTTDQGFSQTRKLILLK